MTHSLFSRLLSLFLVFALLAPCFPPAAASESAESTEPTEAAITITAEESAPSAPLPEQIEPIPSSEETEAADSLEESEVTDPSEEPESSGPSAETEPAEETAVTEPPAETASTEEPEPTEETMPEELPCGFLGMPEGYTPSERSVALRHSMEQHQVLETLSGLIPGESYVENQILTTAETEAEALLIAEAYCGTLEWFRYGIALITLNTATTLEAVTVSMDSSLGLPVAVPNYRRRLEPSFSGSTSDSAFSASAPTGQSWNTWVNETMQNPDPALMRPSAAEYQYMHDVVGTYTAWGVSQGSHDSISVGVIDSGVDVSHPDLQGTIREHDIGCGTGDIVGHGTFVTGIIAATMDNGIGGAGIAPDVVINSYCCADEEGDVDDGAMTAAIYASANNGDDVINISIGDGMYSPLVQEAINYAAQKGATVVASIGNSGSNTMTYPAAMDNVIAVAATDKSNRRAWFSSYGPWADISAPGADIYSTYPLSLDTRDDAQDGYALLCGTSMAAPVVTAAIALYMSVKGPTAPDRMEEILKSSAVKCSDNGTGAGIVNIANMLGGKPEMPGWYIVTGEGDRILPEDQSTEAIPCESTLYLVNADLDQECFTLYTINGKTPSVKNGQVVNGEIYDHDHPGIDLSQFAGTTVTLRAMQVSGVGIPGNVLTQKIKVEESIQVTDVIISGPSLVISGKSGQFTAAVYPTDKADQSVEWSIFSSGGKNISNVKLSAKGLLTTPKNADGTIGICAKSIASGVASDIFYVKIEPVAPVYKAALNQSTGSLYTGQSLTLIPTFTAKDGSGIDPGLSGVQWTTSNARAATVDADGCVTAVGKGKATITCKALDGSNKSAKCTITVKQQITGISITGNTQINPGASTTLKAVIAPANASTKHVTWTLINAPSGVTITGSGKLKVSSSVASGTKITVCATAGDGFGAYNVHTLTVTPKLTSLTMAMRTAYSGLAGGPVFNKKGILTTVNLFSVDLNESNSPDNQCSLWYRSAGPAVLAGTWSSSNPAVATVDNGLVTAHKPGTAKITFTALDGSNKKISTTVKVTVPVSYMEIRTSAPQMSNATPYIGIGKSVANSIFFGNTYGTPSNKKVTWSYEIIQLNSKGDEVTKYDWTSIFKNDKLVKISSAGKVTVDSDALYYWYHDGGVSGEFKLRLFAHSSDGSGAFAYKDFFLIPPATYVTMVEPGVFMLPAECKSAFCFKSDQWRIFMDENQSGFIATSSNPKVCSVGHPDNSDISVVPCSHGHYSNGSTNYYDLIVYSGRQKGTAKITIKTTDGSNKKCSFTLIVN